MEYLTRDEYINMGGTLDSATFKRFLFMSQKEVDSETFGRIKNMSKVPDIVKLLMFELVSINESMISSNGKVASESVGGWSKSFKHSTDEENKINKLDLIKFYLSTETNDKGIPLLYRGAKDVST